VSFRRNKASFCFCFRRRAGGLWRRFAPKPRTAHPEGHPARQLANIIQGRTDDTEMQPVDVHLCDGLGGNSRRACNYYVNIHGCLRPTWTDWHAARLDAETLRLVAAACGWE